MYLFHVCMYVHTAICNSELRGERKEGYSNKFYASVCWVGSATMVWTNNIVSGVCQRILIILDKVGGDVVMAR